MNAPDAAQSIATLDIASADGARAAISPHGAHLVSWIPRRGGERLYLSRKAQAGPGQTIRGGVPVIFPQFALEGSLPKHGFARNAPWTLLAQGRRDDGAAYARYALHDDGTTRALWPHAFAAELKVLIQGDRLSIALTIRNSGDAALQFTAALHSYLRVDDIRHARVGGLQGLRYRDQADHNAEHIEQHRLLAIVGEVDRIYFDTASQLTMQDGVHTLDIRHHGFADAVVWNPGKQKASELHDLDEGGWQQMLCIEAAAIGKPIELLPGQRWTGTQTLEAK